MNTTSEDLVIGNATDVGRVRERNEDYLAHFHTPVGYCIIVCDGVGGHAGGEVASQNCILMVKHFLQDEKNTSKDAPLILKNAIEFANFKLRELVSKDIQLKGMGTTLVLVLIRDGNMYVAHAGDSRAYLIRKNKIKVLTKDHSAVQDLVDSGALSEEEAEISDKKNQITKAIGFFEKVNPTITATPIILQGNDKVLLCSDGLTGHLTNVEINRVVKKHTNIQEATLQLVKSANEKGGGDNITVQLVKFTGKSTRTKRYYVKLLIAFVTSILVVSALYFFYQIYMHSQNNDIQIKPNSNVYDSIEKVKVKMEGEGIMPNPSQNRKTTTKQSRNPASTTNSAMPDTSIKSNKKKP